MKPLRQLKKIFTIKRLILILLLVLVSLAVFAINSIRADYKPGWGVIAFNVDKSVYKVGDKALLQVGVVNPSGYTICDAQIFIKLKNTTNNDQFIFKTSGADSILLDTIFNNLQGYTQSGGEIKKSSECRENYTLIPDYSVEFIMQNSGIYEAEIVAVTEYGKYTIKNNFEVRDNPIFEVKRESAIRIYPFGNIYPTKLTIKANQNFEGIFSEKVPGDFEVSALDNSPEYSLTEDSEGNKILSWDLSLNQGEEIILGYNWLPPEITPQFHLLGPGSFKDKSDQIIFTEVREWQIAADADNIVEGNVHSNSQHGGIINAGPIWKDENTGYVFFLDDIRDAYYKKTTDGGVNWETPVLISGDASRKLSVWYDKWTPGHTGNLIHITYANSLDADINYINLDISTDTLSTEEVIFNGVSLDTATSAWNGHAAYIVRARGGDLIACYALDSTGENGCSKSTDNGDNWSSIAEVWDGNEVDIVLLMPGSETDPNDVVAVYADFADDVARLKTYDQSGNSWSAGTLIGTNTNANFVVAISATQRHSDNHILVAMWTALNHPSADLNFFDFTNEASLPGTGTPTSAIVSNQPLSKMSQITLNQQSGDIYVAYAYAETSFNANQNIYYKVSTDDGSSWSSEVKLNTGLAGDLTGIYSDTSIGTDGGWWMPMWFDNDFDDLLVSRDNSTQIDGIPNQISLVKDNWELNYNACIGFDIQLQDSWGDPLPPTDTTVVRVTSDSGDYTIYNDADCSSEATNGDFTFSSSDEVKKGYIVDLEISASSNLSAVKQSGPETLASDSQEYSVLGATKAQFGNPPRVLLPTWCSGFAKVFTLQLADYRGIPTSPTGETVIRVTSDSSNYTIYSDGSCTNVVTNGDFTFDVGDHTQNFYIIDNVEDPTVTLTATQQSGPDTIATGSQTYSVSNSSSIIRGGTTIQGGTTLQ